VKESEVKTIYLKDYQAPNFKINNVHLTFNLHDTDTLVKSVMNITALKENTPLMLNGENLELVKILVNKKELKKSEYSLSDEFLIIDNLPEKFELVIENKINPSENKALEGLYKSGSIFCTQNEAEGFRRITYFLDRPDVMTKFVTKIIADKEKFPVLLSNGNPINSGDLENGEHFVEWEDPFDKPCYLYALVAGDLSLVQDEYKTTSGRKIDLRIYVDKGNEEKCGHAMQSLKKSMKWDEDTFGLEYDLDIYMIVAVDSFNMGAMENKGLNIFNSAYVLANKETADDSDFQGIEGVIGHEYFHNWTGNRITCRDWFQLTLKEGLTVFRDQEFSADMNDPVVKRIEDVDALKVYQFVEDAGPTAHPIKPKEYIQIDNFYTLTIYEKGAEVIRMIQTFLGKEGFRKGMDKYFKLYDGQAVTTDEFIHSMEVANDIDLSQFKTWYDQAGTPTLDIQSKYDETNKTFELSINQLIPNNPKGQTLLPYHMPLKIGLISKNGPEFDLILDNSDQPQLKDGIIHLRKLDEKFLFRNIESKPVLSLNRNFSAPVKIKYELSIDDLKYLINNETDNFNRYNTVCNYSLLNAMILIRQKSAGEVLKLDDDYIESLGSIVLNKNISYAVKAEMLKLPSAEIIFQEVDEIDPQMVFEVLKFAKEAIAVGLKDKLLNLYNELNTDKEYSLTPSSIGNRSLKSVLLHYLMSLKNTEVDTLCFNSFQSAKNMTDEISTFNELCNRDSEYKNIAIKSFYDKWKNETLVMQKWLAVQARSTLDGTLERVIELESDPIYDKEVPNLLRSLIGSFCRNYAIFHTVEGYKYFTDKIIETDKINPQIASRLIGAFKHFNKLISSKRNEMKPCLERIKNTENLSKNSYEIVSKILEN